MGYRFGLELVPANLVRSTKPKSVWVFAAQFEFCICRADLWSDNQFPGIDLRLISHVF